MVYSDHSPKGALRFMNNMTQDRLYRQSLPEYARKNSVAKRFYDTRSFCSPDDFGGQLAADKIRAAPSPYDPFTGSRPVSTSGFTLSNRFDKPAIPYWLFCGTGLTELLNQYIIYDA
jgi:hypothetical protein